MQHVPSTHDSFSLQSLSLLHEVASSRCGALAGSPGALAGGAGLGTGARRGALQPPGEGRYSDAMPAYTAQQSMNERR